MSSPSGPSQRTTGAVEQPHLWPTTDRPSEERGGQIQTDLLLACDAVLIGRRTTTLDPPAVRTDRQGTSDLLFPQGPPTQFELVESSILKSSMMILLPLAA